METIDINQLTKLYSYEELAMIDGQLTDINNQLARQTKDLEKPDSIVQRVFVDLFGVIALYLLLFFTCDVTQAILNDRPLFGFEWLFFGPYYFFTGAPLMTRVWKSKKFLEDLSELKSDVGGLDYPPGQTCTSYGLRYENACNQEEEHPHRHPLRSKLGNGLDWILRHTIGKKLGGLLGNATCEDQGTTIATDCAETRINAIWECYIAVCGFHNITHIAADINWPNTVASGSSEFRHWDTNSTFAYELYYDAYTAIYDIGSTVFGGHGTPSNLNTSYDRTNYYSYDYATLTDSQRSVLLGYSPLPMPNWFTVEAYRPYANGTMTEEDFIRYFQLHYKEHTLDFWD